MFEVNIHIMYINIKLLTLSYLPYPPLPSPSLSSLPNHFNFCKKPHWQLFSPTLLIEKGPVPRGSKSMTTGLQILVAHYSYS